MQPDALIVQDPTLLRNVDVFAGVKPGGFALINTTKSIDELKLGELAFSLRILTVPAAEMARKHTGRPVANAALLGGFAAVSGQVSLASVAAAIRERFPGKIGEANVAAAEEAYAWVEKEVRDA